VLYSTWFPPRENTLSALRTRLVADYPEHIVDAVIPICDKTGAQRGEGVFPRWEPCTVQETLVATFAYYTPSYHCITLTALYRRTAKTGTRTRGGGSTLICRCIGVTPHSTGKATSTHSALHSIRYRNSNSEASTPPCITLTALYRRTAKTGTRTRGGGSTLICRCIGCSVTPHSTGKATSTHSALHSIRYRNSNSEASTPPSFSDPEHIVDAVIPLYYPNGALPTHCENWDQDAWGRIRGEGVFPRWEPCTVQETLVATFAYYYADVAG
jgi:hypothetical protein